MGYPTRASYSAQGLVWRNLDFPGSDTVLYRLERTCEVWDGTPYMPGQRWASPSGGVDCVRFVCAVLDEMYGVHHEIPRDVQDRSLHDPAGAQRVMDLIRSYYPDHSQLEKHDRVVEPGDIIVTGHSGGGPGHAILVGPRKNTLWQATRRAVRMCGMGLLAHYQQIWTIIRPDKTLWVSREEA